MKVCISILRGINVSGKNPVKMDALRRSYETLGLKNVKTYIQSGNVIFKAEVQNELELAQKIFHQIYNDFGFEVPVIAMNIERLKMVIDNNPFLNKSDKDHSFLHVTFLSSKPEPYDIKSIEEKKLGGEEIAITEHAVYLYCPNGYGKTKLNNGFLEKKLKVSATTRNWKTINELYKIALLST